MIHESTSKELSNSNFSFIRVRLKFRKNLEPKEIFKKDFSSIMKSNDFINKLQGISIWETKSSRVFPGRIIKLFSWSCWIANDKTAFVKFWKGSSKVPKELEVRIELSTKIVLP